MNRFRLLIAAALFACAISAVSCVGASAAGTATVSDNRGVLGNGSLKSGETLGATSIITIDLANVVYADDFTAADDAALGWFRCENGDGKEMAVESLGGIKATASPASSGEGKKDRISIAFSAERLAATDTTLTSVVIPAAKLSSKSPLSVKLGDDGVRVKIVNAGTPKYNVDGATFVGFSGETGAAAASNVTVSYKITDAFVIAGENPVYTNVDVTDWFELKTDSAKNLSDIKVKAKADFISSQEGQDAPRDTMTVTFSTQDSSTDQTNAANPGDKSYKLVIPSENLKGSPEGIVIDDAVRVVVTKKNADRSAAADDGAATPGEVVVSGQTGYALDSGNKSGDAPAPYAVTITLDGDYFMNLAADEGKTYMTVNSWLGLLDEGWECVIEESDLAAAVNGSNKVRISISGKVAQFLTGKIGMTVPAANLLSGQNLTIASSDARNKLTIDVKETPSTEIEIVADNVSGRVGVEMADYDLSLDISANPNEGFKFKSIDQNADVTDWFNLPKGLTAKTTHGITMLGGPTLGIRISGTPLEAFSDEFIVSVPGDKWTNDQGEDGGLYFRFDASDNQKWRISGSASLSTGIVAKDGDKLRFSDNTAVRGYIQLDGDSFKAEGNNFGSLENPVDISAENNDWFGIWGQVDKVIFIDILAVGLDPDDDSKLNVVVVSTPDENTEGEVYELSAFAAPIIISIPENCLKSGVRINDCPLGQDILIGPSGYVKSRSRVSLQSGVEIPTDAAQEIAITIKLAGATFATVADTSASLDGWRFCVGNTVLEDSVTLKPKQAITGGSDTATFVLHGTPQLAWNTSGPIQVLIPKAGLVPASGITIGNDGFCTTQNNGAMADVQAAE